MTRDVVQAIVELTAPVAEALDELFKAERARWVELDDSLGTPLDALRDFVLAGGKRLRPTFCHHAFVGAGGDPKSPLIVGAGAALELLHAFALIHDDVMDDARQRRGQDALHVAFARVHNEQELVGNAVRYGEAVAILLGDMAFVYADRMMSAAPSEALDVFTNMRIELNIGQYLDIEATATSNATRAMAQRIAQYKSGKYTVERPMHLGAALLGRHDELRDAISAYGVPVGEAFQLRDDVLGAFGDEERVGKSVGGDVREGKPTALVAIARERAKGGAADMLTSRYGATDLRDDEITEILAIMVETGALRDVEERIASLVSEGVRAAYRLPFDETTTDSLVELAHFVAGREH